MLIIHNATVVTVDERDSVFHDGAIVIDGDRIAAVGPDEEVRARFPNAERVDAGGKAVMPGFANTHTHLNLTLARGIFEDMSMPNQPPYEASVRLPLPRLSPAENVVLCELGALEALRGGTTLLLEDGIEIETYAERMRDSGLRFLLAERAWDKARGSIGDQGGFEIEPALAERGLSRISALHGKWHGAANGRIRVGAAAWAPDMCSPELLRALAALSERLDLVTTIHLNQLWGEVAAVKSVRGMLPTEYVERQGFLSERLVAAHCRCMEPREEEILGRSRATVAFNSAIAARRGLSPRIAELAAAGCAIAMGSDNMAEDMVEVMRTGMFMERVRRGDGCHPTPELAMRWATVNGYRALGILDGGSLEPGKKADLVIIDTRRPHLVPLMRVVSSFVHQGQARDVDSVMVDGRWLMREGKVLTMDEEAIVAEADRVARNAWRRLFEERPELSVPGGFDLRPVG